MAHLDSFVQLIGMRRRARDRCEAAARLAQEAHDAAEAALQDARRAVEAASRSSESAQRTRAQTPCDPLVAEYCRAEHDRLDACKQDAATLADAVVEAQRALALARLEWQRAQMRLDVLETEHASMQSRERRRGERKREDAQSPCAPQFGSLSALASPC